jgi:biopolymer transport protein ExbB/TolQ
MQSQREPATKPAPWRLEQGRPLIALMCAGIGIAIIIGLYVTLPESAAKVLLDQGQSFPFSVQNAMWISFSIALGELFVRMQAARGEFKQISLHLLPEDPRIVLQAQDLGEIYRNLRRYPNFQQRFLPRLVDRCILQFQASHSSEQSASLLNSSLEMFLHEVDLRYGMLRYICWFIPSLGFIGTVVGIGRALAFAGEKANVQNPDLLTIVTGRLAVSFDGTFLALVMASILLFLQHVVQSKEEHALNLAGQYCLDNLINRLYVKKS